VVTVTLKSGPAPAKRTDLSNAVVPPFEPRVIERHDTSGYRLERDAINVMREQAGAYGACPDGRPIPRVREAVASDARVPSASHETVSVDT